MVTANSHTKGREIINNKPQLAEKRKHLQLGGELVLDLNRRKGSRLWQRSAHLKYPNSISSKCVSYAMNENEPILCNVHSP